MGCRLPSLGDDCMRLHLVSPLIAVIDDDETLCSSLVDLMRSTGYRAQPFASAETFLALSDLVPFACVVADVHLPGMSGLELARKLHERGSTAPVILITGLSDQRLGDETMVGARCLLRKPFETKALLDCVERSLSDDRSPR